MPAGPPQALTLLEPDLHAVKWVGLLTQSCSPAEACAQPQYILQAPPSFLCPPPTPISPLGAPLQQTPRACALMHTQVRVLALDIIAQTARCASPAALKPLLPALVQAMLEGLSSLEDSRYVPPALGGARA